MRQMSDLIEKSDICHYNRLMPRGKALQLGRFYHIYNRGNNRENVFIEERNYRHFLELYARYVHPIADTYAYCLMRNHFHVLGRIKSAAEIAEMSDFSEKSDISAIPAAPTRAFAALFTAYTKAINKAYGRTGRLFQEHFGRIETTSDRYFTNLISYIHFNPQKHGFVDDFRDWPWSSYAALVSDKPTRMHRGDVLAWFGGRQEFAAFHTRTVDEGVIAPLVADDFV
jgi:REP element-mobilizing transposase RayT